MIYPTRGHICRIDRTVLRSRRAIAYTRRIVRCPSGVTLNESRKTRANWLGERQACAARSWMRHRFAMSLCMSAATCAVAVSVAVGNEVEVLPEQMRDQIVGVDQECGDRGLSLGLIRGECVGSDEHEASNADRPL